MISESLTILRLPYPERGERTVRVYVPSHREGETLPVIYMTDGQNLFDEESGSFGCWFTREAVRVEQESSGRAAVIVGIHNDEGPVQRTNELTPKSIGAFVIPKALSAEEIAQFQPQGEVFDRFVTDVVMPAVEERFPVQTGRAATAFCGSSSGGLQAFFTALSHPDLFCAAGVFSPAFPLYAETDLLRWITTKLCAQPPYLYFYTGAGDDLEQTIFESTEAVYDFMTECYPPSLLNEVVLLENRHHESAWESVFRDFLHTFLARREEF